MRVEVNPTQLASYGLTHGERSVRAEPAEFQSGRRARSPTAIVTADIIANDQISHADGVQAAHRRLQQRRGGPAVGCRRCCGLRAERPRRRVPERQARGHIIIFRQPGANIIDTVDRIRARTAFDPGFHPAAASRRPIVLDRTTTIRASVSDVERTLILSIVLVILVVFVFLRNGRATLIPAWPCRCR